MMESLCRIQIFNDEKAITNAIYPGANNRIY